MPVNNNYRSLAAFPFKIQTKTRAKSSAKIMKIERKLFHSTRKNFGIKQST